MSSCCLELSLEAAKDRLVVAKASLHVVHLVFGALLRCPEMAGKEGAGIPEAMKETRINVRSPESS